MSVSRLSTLFLRFLAYGHLVWKEVLVEEGRLRQNGAGSNLWQWGSLQEAAFAALRQLNHRSLSECGSAGKLQVGQPSATMLQSLNSGAGATEVCYPTPPEPVSWGVRPEDWLQASTLAGVATGASP